MTPERKLIYDFLNLPHHIQVGILRQLQLIDAYGDDVDKFNRAFVRARELGKLGELRAAIEDATRIGFQIS